PIAQQEIRRTQQMIDAAKAPGPKAATPAPSGLEQRVQEAQGPVELATISNIPITLKLTEETKVIYETIGKLAGINVLFDPDYTSRRIKIELNGVTLPEALEIVAFESKTFWRPITDNSIFVAADTTAKRKELEQSVVKTFYLSNVSQPTELQDIVNAMRTILEINRIQQLPSQGAIVVRGTPDQVALAEKLINDIDKAKPEVIVDVAIMQVQKGKLQTLGIQPPASVTASYSTPNNVSGGNSNNTFQLGTFKGFNPSENIALTIGTATANFLYNDTSTKIIQNPQIRALDGQKASLKIGDRVPVATGSFQPGIGGVGINPLVNTQFQYIDVGVNIDITPHVHSSEREVSLKMTLEISSVTNTTNIGGIQQPIIGQRKIDHEIRLKDGEINLIGGIFEDQDVKNLSGVPGLSQIPLFKYLFSENRTERTQNEIVFVLIPHIVRSLDLNQANLRPIEVGTGQAIDVRMRPIAANVGGPQGGAGANTQMGRGGATPISAPPRSMPAQQPAQNPATMQPSGGAQPAEQSEPPAAQNPAAPNQAQSQAAPQLSNQPGGTTLSFDPPNANV